MPAIDTTDRATITDWPLLWFVRLSSAIDRGDDSAARVALRNLERLGVEVRFTLPPLRQEVRRVR
jgi:hypothetical protein